MRAALAALAVSPLLVACSGSGPPPDTSPGLSSVPATASPAAAGPATVTQLDQGPVGVADVDGRPWFAQPVAGTVRTGTGAEVAVGEAPLRLVDTPAGVWVSVIRDGTVVRLDHATGAVARTVRLRPAGSEPEGVAWDGRSLWVVDQAHDRVVRLDQDGGLRAAYDTGAEPRLVAAGPGGAWVTGYSDSSLTRVQGRTARTVPLTGCVGPQGVAESAGRVWVACTLSGSVVAVDARTMRVVATVGDVPDADAVVVHAGTIDVVGQNGPTVYVIDAVAGELRDKVVLDNVPSTTENVGAAIVDGDLVVTQPDERRVYRLPLP